MVRLLSALALATGLLAAAPSGAATITIVDLDARVNVRGGGLDNPVFVLLEAGDYTVAAMAGTFTAWNAWFTTGGTAGCVGDACAKGWVNNWSIFTPDSATVPYTVLAQGTGQPGRNAWRTPELALAAAKSFAFTLLAPERVGFVIADTPVTDNTGGMSLQIDRADPAVIPLPPALGLILGAFAGLWLFGRRRLA